VHLFSGSTVKNGFLLGLLKPENEGYIDLPKCQELLSSRSITSQNTFRSSSSCP